LPGDNLKQAIGHRRWGKTGEKVRSDT